MVDTDAERRSQMREMAGDADRRRRVLGYACRWDWIERVDPEAAERLAGVIAVPGGT